MITLEEAFRRMQERHEARHYRVRVVPDGKMFTVEVDGELVLLPGGKAKKFRSAYKARQFGLSLTWTIDEGSSDSDLTISPKPETMAP